MKPDTDWRPARGSGIPLYRQIADYIRNKIAHGEWPAGSRIPTERALAATLGVNRSTVVAAFAELAAEGLLEGKSGRGTVVANNTWTLMAAKPPPDWEAYVHAAVHRPNLPTVQEINRAEFRKDVIRLGTGEPSPALFPREQMNRMIRRLPGKIGDWGYVEPKGLYPLREQISEFAKRIGIEASPSSVLIVSGALQALQLIAVGLLPRGSAVLTEQPSYLQSLHVFQSAGMRLSGVPLDAEGVVPERLAYSADSLQGSLLYTIPCFHNPTGIVMSERRRAELYGLCLEKRLPIIEDDVYRDLWLDEEPPPPLKARDRSGMALYLGSMSKTLSPGLRIGWLIGPEPVVDRLADVKMQTDYGASTLSQWAVAEWLASGLYGGHLAAVRESLRERRASAIRSLGKHLSGVAEWRTPAGGFYIWVKLAGDVRMKKLFDRALRRGVLLNPGHLYDRSDTRHLRISYAYAEPERLDEGIRIVAELLQERGG